MKLKINNISNVFFMYLLIIMAIEKLYNHNNATGYYGKYTLLVLFFCGVIKIFHDKIITNSYAVFSSKTAIWSCVFVAIFVIYTYSRFYNSLTNYYILLIITLYLLKDISIKGEYLFGSIYFLGMVYGIIDFLGGDGGRITGFLATSPTLFSYIISISVTYFLFLEDRSFLRIFYFLSSSALVYLTGTRTTLIYILFLFIYTGFRTNKKLYGLIILCLLTLYLCHPFSGFSIREGAEYSTRDRLFLIQYFFNLSISDMKNLIFGLGGGYTSYMVPQILGIYLDSYPLHQDILMWLVEYGCIGVFMLLIYIILLVRKKDGVKGVYVILGILFMVGTSHNILISPICLILLISLGNSLNDSLKNTKR